MSESEPKREQFKNEGELEEPTKTKIIGHLNYREKKMQDLIRICARLSPASGELEKDTAKYYKKLAESLNNGEPDKNILYELNLPGEEEDDLKEKINEELKLLKSLTPEEIIGEKGKEVVKNISKMETSLLDYETERKGLIEKLSKESGKKKEKKENNEGRET